MRRGRGEHGTSLVIALAFLGLLATGVISMLTVTFAGLKTTTTVRHRHATTYGADGGADLAIQRLRTSSTYCPEVASGTQSFPTETINGQSVNTTCQTLSGSAGGTILSGPSGGYALVVTGFNDASGSAPDFTKLFELDGKDKDGSDSIRVAGGKVFSAGKFKFKSDAPTLIIENELDQYEGSGSYCTTDKAGAAVSGQPQVSGSWTCRSSSTFPVPDGAPTVKVPAAAPFPSATTGDCTILFPGKYTSRPTFDKDHKYYLASGVYYFENVGDIKLQGQIFGGAPASTEAQAFTDMTPCATDSAANALHPGSATGFGVELVIGGNTKLQVEDEKKAKIELFTRVAATPSLEGTPGVTIFAPRTAGPGYLAWNQDRALDFKGENPQVVIHGLVYIPTAKLDEQFALANSSAGYAPPFSGGLVVQRLKLKFKKDAANLTFAQLPAGVPTPRTVVVTSTATPSGGGAATTVQVIIRLDTASGTPATVLSWRKI